MWCYNLIIDEIEKSRIFRLFYVKHIRLCYRSAFLDNTFDHGKEGKDFRAERLVFCVQIAKGDLLLKTVDDGHGEAVE